MGKIKLAVWVLSALFFIFAIGFTLNASDAATKMTGLFYIGMSLGSMALLFLLGWLKII